MSFEGIKKSVTISRQTQEARRAFTEWFVAGNLGLEGRGGGWGLTS